MKNPQDFTDHTQSLVNNSRDSQECVIKIIQYPRTLDIQNKSENHLHFSAFSGKVYVCYGLKTAELDFSSIVEKLFSWLIDFIFRALIICPLIVGREPVIKVFFGALSDRSPWQRQQFLGLSCRAQKQKREMGLCGGWVLITVAPATYNQHFQRLKLDIGSLFIRQCLFSHHYIGFQRRKLSF